MCERSDKNIEQIQADSQIIEDPHDKGTSENRIGLVQEDEKNLPKTGDRFSGCDIKPSFQETVGKLEKSISQSDKKTDQYVIDKCIFVIDIKEIQMIDRGRAAYTAPDDRKECIQYKITDKTLPGFVIAEDPLSVGKTSAEIHRLFQ